MTIDESSPDPQRATAEVSGGTEELRALLVGYASALQTIDDAPAIPLPELDGSRLWRWLRRLAPHRLVRALLLHHVSRCVSALKSSVTRCVALDGDAAGPERDLQMLERFEQSLPTRLRLALIWPLGLLGVLLVAYILANFFKAGYSTLLGDLTTAAVSLNRSAAIAAFVNFQHREQQSGATEIEMYAGAIIIVTWSAVLMIFLLLPAFAVKRKLLARLAGLESSGFAALGVRPIYDIELDLIAYLFQLPTVAVFGIILALQVHEHESIEAQVLSWVLGGVMVALTVLAGFELRARYAARRAAAQRRNGRVLRISLRLVSLLSLLIFVALVRYGREDSELKPFDMVAGQEGSFAGVVNFIVAGIEPDAPCHDPYRPLKPGQQFLRFDLEVWSAVDQFIDSGVPTAMSLHHWSVANSHGVLENNPVYMYSKCGDGEEVISKPIVPGAHTKTVVVIDAPRPAAFLQLDVPTYNGLYKWPIPPAGS